MFGVHVYILNNYPANQENWVVYLLQSLGENWPTFNPFYYFKIS